MLLGRPSEKTNLLSTPEQLGLRIESKHVPGAETADCKLAPVALRQQVRTARPPDVASRVVVVVVVVVVVIIIIVVVAAAVVVVVAA